MIYIWLLLTLLFMWQINMIDEMPATLESETSEIEVEYEF